MSAAQIKILVVDDEEAMREVLAMRLQGWGYEVKVASDGQEGGRLASSYKPDIVLSDIVMPEISGLELLRSLKKGDPSRPVILITAHGAVDVAVEAMKQGAHDFITKPLDYSKLKAILTAAEKDVSQRVQTRKLATKLKKGAGFQAFVGTSKTMRTVYELIVMNARSDAAVLITGESGTGKELVARTVHDLSKRSEGPFVAINTAAIPDELMESEIFGHERGAFTGAVDVRVGCFELADKGTLFLDEIGEMPMALQPKLLRVLEDGRLRRVGGKQELHFDVRVLTATNRDPRKSVEAGQIREDLYYRINVLTVHLPPLRERDGDVPLLVQHFIADFNAKHDTNVEAARDETLKIMEEYDWPGNVRELRNVIERAVVLARDRWIEPSHLPPYVVSPAAGSSVGIVLPVDVTAAGAEKELILRTLERVGQNKAEAARQLGLDVKTIRNKLKSYGL